MTRIIKSGENPRLQGSGMTSLFNNGAFTLIEMLVVVLIIGILAAIALPQYQRAVKLAQYRQQIILGNTFAKAQTLYYLENGSYAKDLSDLPISLPTPDRTRSTSTDISWSYSWGRIALRFIDTNSPDIQIYSTQGLPTYEVAPLSGGRWRYRCYATVNNSMQQHICRSVAGSNIPPESSYTHLTYNF